MQRGYSNLELLVVLFIFSIAVILGSISFSKVIAEQELDATARILVSDIRWVQQMSLNTEQPATLIQFSHSFPYGYYITRNTFVIHSAIFPSSIRIASPVYPIQFNSDGRPSGRSAQTITITGGSGSSKQIFLMPVTGRVRYQ